MKGSMELSHSKPAERESISSSAPRNKRKRAVLKWVCAEPEEVGDSDDLRVVRSRGKYQSTQPGSRDGFAGAECLPKVEEKVPISIQSHMEKMLEELKQARAELFQWMQQEIQKMLCGESSSPSLPNGAEAQQPEEAGNSLQDLPVSASCLNSGGIQSQVGYWHTTNRSGFTEHSRETSFIGPHGGGKSNIGKSFCSREYVTPDKYKNSLEDMGAVLPWQKVTPLEHVFGPNGSKCMDSREQSRESPGFVSGMQDKKVGFVSGMQDKKVGFVGFGREFVGESQLVGLSVQPDLQGDTGLGTQVGIDAVMKYGVQRSSAATANFGPQVGNSSKKRTSDFRNSAAAGTTCLASSGIGPNQGSLLRAFVNERTDLMGMPGMQNSSVFNIIQNTMQSERNCNYMFGDPRIPKFHHDAHGKLLNGGMNSYRGLISNGAAYESSAGMVHAAGMQSANGIFGVQPPLVAENRFSSVGSPGPSMFMSIQNQVAIQDQSSKQNFLGFGINRLAVGTSANRQAFPGNYLQENLHYNMPSSKGAMPTLAEHRTSHGIQGVDTLELNA